MFSSNLIDGSIGRHVKLMPPSTSMTSQQFNYVAVEFLKQIWQAKVPPPNNLRCSVGKWPATNWNHNLFTSLQEEGLVLKKPELNCNFSEG